MSMYEEEFNYLDRGLLPGDPPNQRKNESWAEVGCAVVEAKYFHDGGSLGDTRPSVQHLIDCNNCDSSEEFGGHIDAAWFFMEHFGTAITADYPRRTDGTRTECLECQGSVIPKLSIDGFKTIDVNVDAIINALHKEGPLAVLFWCGTDAWHHYRGGITEDGGIFPGKPSDPNVQARKQYVTLVGHDIKRTYWILRNTAGAGWGDKGLMRLRMEKTDCFIEVSTPIRPHRIDRDEGESLSRNKENKKRECPIRGGGKVNDDEGKKKNKKGGNKKLKCLIRGVGKVNDIEGKKKNKKKKGGAPEEHSGKKVVV